MKILITGAGGMLGTDLAARLTRHGPVAGAGRRPATHLAIPYRLCDFSSESGVNRLIHEESPEIIFHAAAMTDVDGCETRRDEAFRDNVIATRLLGRAAASAGALVIFFSTDYVHDGSKKGEYSETDATAPLNTYGRSKLEAEEELAQSGAACVIFRTSWLYGLRGRSFPRTILEKSKTIREFKVVSDQVGRPTYTRDIAEGIGNLLGDHPAGFRENSGQIFNLAGDGVVSWAGFARGILKAAKIKGVEVLEITSDQLNRPATRPPNSVLSLEKIHRVLGIRVRSWEQALPDFIHEWDLSEKAGFSA